MSDKQDRIALRNVIDLERKYKFKQKFSDTLGLIDDTRKQTDSVELSMNTAIRSHETKLTDQEEKINSIEQEIESHDTSIKSSIESLSDISDSVLELSKKVDLKLDINAVNTAIDKKLTIGSWTPSLASDAISAYISQVGWFAKMGQIVIVGFAIRATCNPGYDGINISISGLPFTPLFSAAGGGVCSGAYVSGGNNFLGFIAETSGLITTRVQACNNTLTTNLITSSSDCCYPSGGGELTLSGTITFMSTS